MLFEGDLARQFPCLAQFTQELKIPSFEIQNRDEELRAIEAALNRPELCNVLLLGEPGSGKTALVQATMMHDRKRLYLEVDLSKMISDCNDVNEMATRLKTLCDEVTLFRTEMQTELVLFMDEFHQVMMLSNAAAEALKPLLADSGTRGVRIIAATTEAEFRIYIAPNQPLVERLQRIRLRELDREATINVLKNRAVMYGVADQFYNDNIYELIYEYTQRYIPANAQPRKSLLILDAMIGWYRSEGRLLDKQLLADVIYESEGVNVTFKVDATSIKKELDKYVYAQDFATRMIEQRLQICVADLNNKSKPMSSFLFTGSTGVGKTEVTKQLAVILFGDNARSSLIRFDMTEYANDDSLERFRSELTARVWNHPYSIVLFDEIEKACAPVTRILLQVLDDGRLMDENNREVSFLNAYIVLTTNAGSEIYKTLSQYATDDSGSGKEMKKYDKLIRQSISSTTGSNRFPPELLGRIDTIVPFQPLSEQTQKRIAKNKLDKLVKEVSMKHDIELSYDPKVIRYLVEDNLDSDSDSGGARRVISKLETEVTTAVAKFINKYPTAYRIQIIVEGDMMSDNKNQLESQAYISIRASNGVRQVSKH
jgi:ATP-dependent Clp protease ATP-binding subunit ClpC